MKTCKVHGPRDQTQIYSNGACKECAKIKWKKRYQANPDIIKERVKRHRAQNPEYYKKYKAEYQEKNREERKEKSRTYYQENKEKVKAKVKQYVTENKEAVSTRKRKHWKENAEVNHEKSKVYRAANREALAQKKWEYYQNIRKEAISKYSNGLMVCASCSHDMWTDLCLDHINDGGTQDRKSNPQVKGHAVFTWVKKNDYPPIFQVLCYNCNQIKHVSKHPGYTSTSTYNLKLKTEVLSPYSQTLTCPCGFSDIRALTLDHIDGGGRKQLSEIGIKGGPAYYRWIRREKYPGGLQVLCFNCNCRKNSLRRAQASTGQHDLPLA